MTNIKTNIGRIFYKEYYNYLYNSQDETDLSIINKKIFDVVKGKKNIESIGFKQKINLTTSYPGLLIGSGYTHETGEKDKKDEIKIGFFFDYTSGLPCIQGSSVKGMLRSAFKKANGKYVEELLKKQKLESIKIEDLENEIFEGKDKSIYQRDMFFDAFPISTENGLLGNDYITPHAAPLKNPVPLQFLKVLPQVEFQFNFDLKNGIIKADEKEKLFRQILLDFGIGAKTNVGYGQFEQSMEEIKHAEKMQAEMKRQKEIDDSKKRLQAIENKKIEEEKIKIAKREAEAKERQKMLSEIEEKKNIERQQRYKKAQEEGIKALLAHKDMKSFNKKIKSWANNFYQQPYNKCIKDIKLQGKLIPQKYIEEFIHFIDKIYEIEQNNNRTKKEWKKNLNKNQYYKLLTFCIGEKANKWF